MADILIRGMEMPKDGTYSIVYIYSDGHISMPCLGKGMQIVSGITAVQLPEGHGRLIDGDALMPDFAKAIWEFRDGYTFQWLLEHAPTIVPAEGSGEDG